MADSAISYHQAAQAKTKPTAGGCSGCNQALAGDKLASLHELGMKLFGEELNSKQDGDRDFSTVAIGHLEDRDKQYLFVVAKRDVAGAGDISCAEHGCGVLQRTKATDD